MRVEELIFKSFYLFPKIQVDGELIKNSRDFEDVKKYTVKCWAVINETLIIYTM